MLYTEHLGQTGLFHVDKTTLLVSMEGTDGGTTFVDRSGQHRLVHSVVGATTSSSQAKVGSTSGSFDKSTTTDLAGDYVTFAETLDCVMVDDYTIQYWVYLKSTTPNSERPQPVPKTSYSRMQLAFGDKGTFSAAQWIWQSYNTLGNPSQTTPWQYIGLSNAGLRADTFTTSAWHHVAYCRYVSATGKWTVEGWFDGVSIGIKDEDSASWASSGLGAVICLAPGNSNLTEGYTLTTLNAYISGGNPGTTRAAGDQYLDELQVINGTALYRDGVTFTPPAGPL